MALLEKSNGNEKAGRASNIISDPEKQPDDIRSEYTISSAELRKAAQILCVCLRMAALEKLDE